MEDLTPDKVELMKAGVEQASAFASRLLANPLKILSSIGEDWMMYFQWKSRISILKKAETILSKNPVFRNAIPEGFFLSFLEKTASVYNEDLHEKWAYLLVNSIMHEEYRHPALLNALSSLDSRDCELLSDAVDNWLIAIKPSESARLYRLVALGLIRDDFDAEAPSDSGTAWKDVDINHNWILSPFGVQLLEAVHPEDCEIRLKIEEKRHRWIL